MKRFTLLGLSVPLVLTGHMSMAGAAGLEPSCLISAGDEVTAARAEFLIQCLEALRASGAPEDELKRSYALYRGIRLAVDDDRSYRYYADSDQWVAIVGIKGRSTPARKGSVGPSAIAAPVLHDHQAVPATETTDQVTTPAVAPPPEMHASATESKTERSTDASAIGTSVDAQKLGTLVASSEADTSADTPVIEAPAAAAAEMETLTETPETGNSADVLATAEVSPMSETELALLDRISEFGFTASLAPELSCRVRVDGYWFSRQTSDLEVCLDDISRLMVVLESRSLNRALWENRELYVSRRAIYRRLDRESWESLRVLDVSSPDVSP